MSEPRSAEPLVFVQGAWLFEQLADWQPYRLELLQPDVRNGRGDCEVLVWDGSPLTRDHLDTMPGLRLVAGFATGYGGVDLAELRRRGIALSNGAGVNAHDVADHAMALLLGYWHRIPALDADVRAGLWQAGKPLRVGLRGRRAGIVGLGRIGEAIARRLDAFDLDIAWWGPRPKAGCDYPRRESLESLAAWADILVVACRAGDDNSGLVSGEILEALGSGGILVNVSRGSLVDEAALQRCLRDGRLGGAALDVFAVEPGDTSWADVPRTLLSPHVGGATVEALDLLIGQVKENVRRHFAGEALLSNVLDQA